MSADYRLYPTPEPARGTPRAHTIEIIWKDSPDYPPLQTLLHTPPENRIARLYVLSEKRGTVHNFHLFRTWGPYSPGAAGVVRAFESGQLSIDMTVTADEIEDLLIFHDHGAFERVYG